MFASNAMAQAKNFEGFSVGGSIGLVKSGYEGRLNGVTLGVNDNDVLASIQLDYTHPVSSNAVIGFGATLGLSEVKSGSVGTTSLKSNNISTFYVSPGIATSDTTLIFGKLGLVKTTGTSNTAGSTSEDFNGVWVGAGVRVLLSKNAYVQAEYGQANFNSKESGGVSYNPTMSGFNVGVGYKF
jgi:opacity protein-like surface antigen